MKSLTDSSPAPVPVAQEKPASPVKPLPPLAGAIFTEVKVQHGVKRNGCPWTRWWLAYTLAATGEPCVAITYSRRLGALVEAWQKGQQVAVSTEMKDDRLTLVAVASLEEMAATAAANGAEDATMDTVAIATAAPAQEGGAA